MGKKFSVHVVRNICIACFILLIFVPQTSAQQNQLRFLVTGFEPFGKFSTNPSNELVEFINSARNSLIDGVTLKAITLPVTYFESWGILSDEVNEFNPDYILSFGYAPGSDKIQLEANASNYDHGYADNKFKRHNGAIVKNAPKSYPSELPIKMLANSLKKKGIPVTISSDAGGYICNHIFFQERHFTSSQGNIRSGFFHIPNWPVKGEKGLWNVLKEIILALKKNSIKIGVFEFEPKKDNILKNIELIERIILKTKRHGLQFYIFPEMALTGLLYNSSKELLNNNKEYEENSVTKILEELSIKNNVFMSVGLVTINNGTLYNSYQIYSPHGLIYTYNKNHLYGSDWNWAEKGTTYPVIETDFGKIGVLICHDVVYKESFKSYLNKNVNMLIVGTNWIGKTPISHYLHKYLNDNLTFFVSDRKGKEKNTEFIGNTSIISSGQSLLPKQIEDGITGVIYLHASD